MGEKVFSGLEDFSHGLLIRLEVCHVDRVGPELLFDLVQAFGNLAPALQLFLGLEQPLKNVLVGAAVLFQSTLERFCKKQSFKSNVYAILAATVVTRRFESVS